MSSEKRQITEGKNYQIKKTIRTFGEKENYKYLRILEEDTIKKHGDKRSNEKILT